MIRTQINNQIDILEQTIEDIEREEERDAKIRKRQFMESILSFIGISAGLIDAANNSTEENRIKMAGDLNSEIEAIREGSDRSAGNNC